MYFEREESKREVEKCGSQREFAEECYSKIISIL
jgi:hypothetical protein